MLDEIIRDQIIEREINKEKKKQQDSGWQPIPLYKELELPREAPQKKEKSPSGPIEIEIWGPEADDTIIQTCPYTNSIRYSW